MKTLIKNRGGKIISLASALLVFLSLTNISCDKQVSVSPPDAPPPNGYAFIDSYPRGFHIYLQNRPRRRATPDSLTWLTTGTYQITLKKDLFRDTSITIDVVEGEKKNFFVDIAKNPAMLGSILCNSNPQGANIIVNDSVTGKVTPAEIKDLIPGHYSIRYNLKNHRDDSTLVTVSSSNQSAATFSLVDTTVWRDYDTGNSAIPTDMLTCVYVDRQNVIWVGTDGNGLLKFENGQWAIYTMGSTALPSNYISCITSDENGTKWVGTSAGLVEFNTTPDAGMSEYDLRNSGLPSVNIQALLADKVSGLWIATDGGLSQTYLEGGARKWKNYSTTASELIDWILPDAWVTTLVLDSKGLLWVGTKHSGITYYDGPAFNTINASIPSNYITASALDKDGLIWFTHDAGSLKGSGISFYNGSAFESAYNLPFGSSSYFMISDKDNNKWIATNKGVVRFVVPSASTTYNYQSTGLNINSARGIAQDKNGHIWIATHGGGLIEMKKVN